jgi:hypothetical protein
MMEKQQFLQGNEAKVINMEDYIRKQAIIGILNRKELSQQMKEKDEELRSRFYAQSDHLDDKSDENEELDQPVMKLVPNEEEEKALKKRFYALSDHLD